MHKTIRQLHILCHTFDIIPFGLSQPRRAKPYEFRIEGWIFLCDIFYRHQNRVISPIQNRCNITHRGVVDRYRFIKMASIKYLGIRGTPLGAMHKRQTVLHPHKSECRTHRLGEFDRIDLQRFVFMFTEFDSLHYATSHGAFAETFLKTGFAKAYLRSWARLSKPSYPP